MSCSTPSFVVGDAGRSLRATILNGAGQAISLVGASASFSWRLVGTVTPVAIGAATVVDVDRGVIEYTFAAGDLPVAGSYVGEFEISFGGPGFTAPSDGPIPFTVRPAL